MSHIIYFKRLNHFKKLIKAHIKIWMQKLLGFSNKMCLFVLAWKLEDNPILSDFKPWFIDWKWIDCILLDILDSPVPSPAAGLRFRLVHGTLDTTNQHHIASKNWVFATNLWPNLMNLSGRFKFKPRLKYVWFHLKLYQMFQDLSRR